MNSYNGFSPNQRMKALRWLRDQQAKGLRDQKPVSCDVCHQTEGLLDFHSEDYSEPFGPNIGEYSLCYICHMMIHCRFRNRASWNIYKKYLREGKQFKPYYFRDWQNFKKDCLIERFANREYKVINNTGAKILDSLGHQFISVQQSIV